MTLSLALSALALSLLGAAHCAAMCGGFVAAAHVRGPAPGEAHPALMHAGRIASYALIGAAMGAAGAIPMALAASPTTHRVLFLVACAVLAASGLAMAGAELPRAAHGMWSRTVGRTAANLARRIAGPRTPLRALALGALWGWAPCALVYAALPLALVSGSAGSGAIVMLAFGAGTLPALAGAGWLLQRFSRPAARTWIGGAVVALAVGGALQALLPQEMLPPFLCAPSLAAH